jgi:hypothetical protein
LWLSLHINENHLWNPKNYSLFLVFFKVYCDSLLNLFIKLLKMVF